MPVTSKQSCILVTGATGTVGPRVVDALIKAGYQIRTLSLDKPPADIWPNDIEERRGDVTDLATVKAAVQGMDSVVHLASLLHIVNPTSNLQQKYELINVGGTRNVVEASISANVRRVLLFSTIAVYGETNGQIVTERTQPNPNTFYGQSKLEAERIVMAARNSAGEPMGTVLRLAAVYGSRIQGNYRRLLVALNRGRFFPIGRGRNRRTLIYDKDVANAAVLALRHQAAAGRIYNVSDGKYHMLCDIIGTMSRALGRKPPHFFLPVAPIRLTASLLENVPKMIGLKSMKVMAKIDKYLEDIAVDNRLIQRELGFKPKFSLADGWEEAIQEMRQSGNL